MNFFIFLWNFKIGGIQKHGVLLANHLTRLGWKVTIIYSEKEGDLLSILDESVVLAAIKIPNTNSLLRLRSVSRELINLIPKDSIILCNGPNNFRQIGRINFILRRWKLLFILHNDLEFSQGWGRFFKQLEIRMTCNSSKSHIVALSKKQRQNHENRLSLKKLKVIPNFIDFDHKYLTNFSSESTRGVSVGRYAYQKGYDILLESMKRVNSNIHLDIYGFGSEEKMKLEGKSKEYGLKNIVFKGPTLDVFEVLVKYDFFVLSSRFEPFGIVVAEALSCGLPVVTTDCDGPLDMINESNGAIVAKDDPNALAKGITKIANDIKLGRFNTNLVRDTAKKYSVDTVVDQYLELFQ